MFVNAAMNPRHKNKTTIARKTEILLNDDK